jgi:1-acyl-sn-glycerol-3-phosphate acyltransferase
MAYRRGDSIVRFTPAFLPFTALYYILLPLATLFDRVVFGLKVRRKQNLSEIERAVLISNHTLLMDPGVISHAIRPNRAYFTMLEETALIPFLGTFTRLLGGIPIPEHRSSMLALGSAVHRALEKMSYVHFFPEGECYLWNQQLRPYHLGAFYLACRLNVPVIPLTIVLHERRLCGKESLRLAGRKLRLPPCVTVVIGKPLYPGRFMGTAQYNAIEKAAEPSPIKMGAGSGSITGGKEALLKAAKAMSSHTMKLMQETIDRLGGSRTIYRGKMPRVARQNQKRTASGAAI